MFGDRHAYTLKFGKRFFSFQDFQHFALMISYILMCRAQILDSVVPWAVGADTTMLYTVRYL